MSTLFISHSSTDSEAANELAGWLQRQGHHSLFLDFDPEYGIPPGRDWEEELYRQLKACQAFVALCSEAAMASCWCLAELSHARALGKLIVPVRIAPCTLRPQLAELQIIDLIKEPELGYERLREALTGVFDWDRRRPPYPGMMAFEEVDAAIFFGRDAEIQQALDRLQQVRNFGGPRLQLFLGASGSGKSSLVRAGIMPRLRAAPDAWSLIGPVRTRDRPLDELLAQLGRELPAEGGVAEEVLALASRAETAPQLLPRAQQVLRRRPDRAHATLVLVIDQLEELLLPLAQAEELMRILRPALQDPDASVLVIATLRSDFLGSLQAHPDWRDLRPEMVTVAPLSVEGFSAVIEGPAELAGLELEPSMVRAMVADTATPDALPLLAFTLRELWEMAGEDGRLTLAEYERLGGLHGSVAKAAEAVLGAVAPGREQRRVLRSALFALVRLDEEGRYTRQVVRWEDLPAASHPLLEAFIQARLLIVGSHDGIRTLEVAHESLFRVWQRLNRWLEANREALRVHDGLRRAAQEWQGGGRPAELLNHRGRRLKAALSLARKGPFPLGDTEWAYLKACRRRDLRKRLGIIAGALSVVAVVIGLFWQELSRRQQVRDAQQSEAELHWASGISARDRDADFLKASHHFVHAAELELKLDPARAASAYWAAVWLGSGPKVMAAADLDPAPISTAFDTTGDAVRLWDGDGASQVWRWEEGTALPPLASGSHRGQITSADGRPLARWIVLRDDDGVVELRDRRSGAPGITTPPGAIGVWIGDTDEATAVSAHVNGDIRVWDLARGESRGGWHQATGVAGVAISPNGNRLLFWTPDGAAILRDDNGPREVVPPVDDRANRIRGGALGRQADKIMLWGSDGRIWFPERPGFEPAPVAGGFCGPGAIGARFLDALPDSDPLENQGRLLIWNHGACGTARLWDLATQRPVGTVMRHGPEITGLAVHKERLLTWSQLGGPARLWHLATGEAVATLDTVTEARFTAGDLLLTWDDSKARLWSSQSGEPLGLPLHHGGPIREVIASEDGRHLLSWADDGSLRLWQAPPSPVAMTLRLPAAVLDAVLVTGEETVRVVSPGGEVYVWSTSGDAPLKCDSAPLTCDSLDSDARFASFAPGGDRLLTANVEGDVRLWSWEAGRFEPLAFPGGTIGNDPVAGVAWGAGADSLLFWGLQECTAWLWRVGKSRAVPLEHGDDGQETCRLHGAVLASDGSGRALTWGEDRRLRLWDLEGGDPVLVGTIAKDVLVRTAELDGDRLLVAIDEGGVSLSQLNNSDVDMHLSHAAVRGARWDSEGERVLSWGGGSTRIWEDGTLQAFLASEADLEEAAFMAGGERVLSWENDGGVQVWDALEGHPLTPVLRGPGPDATALDSDVGAGQMRLLIAARDSVTLWRLPAFATPPPRPTLRQELLTGTRLTIPGEVEVLSAEAWQEIASSLAGTGK
ncbi:nSTAND1 domain-containing NTPase [Halomonas ramblicola]|uniref:nSTAND1 domain-containing NTPase n=1 Tax=Halomonas ramblicola TaxID=747349 RepID=UPI0025B628CA|nr:TIR domain-containing protein [Halomonas ramblicola]MDN3523569.1 TIR domain-containing protein [Halomonas ramblicola]